MKGIKRSIFQILKRFFWVQATGAGAVRRQCDLTLRCALATTAASGPARIPHEVIIRHAAWCERQPCRLPIVYLSLCVDTIH